MMRADSMPMGGVSPPPPSGDGDEDGDEDGDGDGEAGGAAWEPPSGRPAPPPGIDGTARRPGPGRGEDRSTYGRGAVPGRTEMIPTKRGDGPGNAPAVHQPPRRGASSEEKMSGSEAERSRMLPQRQALPALQVADPSPRGAGRSRMPPRSGSGGTSADEDGAGSKQHNPQSPRGMVNQGPKYRDITGLQGTSRPKLREAQALLRAQNSQLQKGSPGRAYPHGYVSGHSGEYEGPGKRQSEDEEAAIQIEGEKARLRASSRGSASSGSGTGAAHEDAQSVAASSVAGVPSSMGRPQPQAQAQSRVQFDARQPAVVRFEPGRDARSTGMAARAHPRSAEDMQKLKKQIETSTTDAVSRSREQSQKANELLERL